MEVAEYVQWTYYESIWNTIWLESNQDFISLLLFLDITFIQNLEQFLLAIPTTFLQILVSLSSLLFYFFLHFSFSFRFFTYSDIFLFFLFLFPPFPVGFWNVFFHFPRWIDTFELKLFIKHRRYASTVFVFALPRRHCALHYCCLSSVQTSFRFHLSVSFPSKPNSKRISTPSLVDVSYIYTYMFSCREKKRIGIFFDVENTFSQIFSKFSPLYF